ncbi:MAG: porin family protein [Syntrophaceae bacterium]|nr:porin family protein [Syntrophaceae bacterium]
MKKTAGYLLTFAFAIVFALCPCQSASAEVGLYIGGWGGYTISPDVSGDDGYHYDDYDWDVKNTSAWGIKVGYTNPFFKFLALEAEYSYLNPKIEDSSYADGDIKISNLMFNVIGKYPLGIVKPYFGVGLGFSYADQSLEDIEGIDKGDYTSYAWQIMTGAEFYLTSEIAVDVGYRYYATEMEVESGHSDDATFYTGMVTLGLKVFF